MTVGISGSPEFGSRAAPNKNRNKGGEQRRYKLGSTPEQQAMAKEVLDAHQRKETGQPNVVDRLRAKFTEMKVRLSKKKDQGKLTAKERHDWQMAEQEERLVQNADKITKRS